MHAQITAEEYESWSEEQCAGIEIMDGMVIVRPSASKRHNRLARVLANALDAAAGPDRNADTDFDVRLQDVPLTNRRPDVVVYRADTIDVTPTRPELVRPRVTAKQAPEPCRHLVSDTRGACNTTVSGPSPIRFLSTGWFVGVAVYP
jgi:hypothetical protein